VKIFWYLVLSCVIWGGCGYTPFLSIPTSTLFEADIETIDVFVFREDYHVLRFGGDHSNPFDFFNVPSFSYPILEEIGNAIVKDLNSKGYKANLKSIDKVEIWALSFCDTLIAESLKRSPNSDSDGVLAARIGVEFTQNAQQIIEPDGLQMYYCIFDVRTNKTIFVHQTDKTKRSRKITNRVISRIGYEYDEAVPDFITRVVAINLEEIPRKGASPQ